MVLPVKPLGISIVTSDTRNMPRPRRSVLYMPGANARAIEKARSLPCDAVILDLEDAVSPDAKEAARAAVAASVAQGGFGRREVIIRVNGLDTMWAADDLAAVAKSGAHAVLIPKVSSAGDLIQVESALADSGAPRDLAIWAMMETPRAILNADAIAGATARLAVFVMGTNDLLKELNAVQRPDRQPLMLALQMALLAGRAHGLALLDGVYNAISNQAGFEAECAQGRDLGFDGKTLIHPSQVDAANRIFAPSEDEIEKSRRIIEAFDQATAQGKGVVQLDGKMIENLHVDHARRVLAFAEILAGSAP